MLSVTGPGLVPGSDARQTPGTGASDGWITVKEWSGGHGRVTTDVFAPASRPWRVSYRATAGERWGLLDLLVRTKDAKYVGSALNMHLMAFDEAQRSGSFLVDSGENQYVLEVVSDNLSWEVAVERRK